MSFATAPPSVTNLVPGSTGTNHPLGTATRSRASNVSPASAATIPVDQSALISRSRAAGAQKTAASIKTDVAVGATRSKAEYRAFLRQCALRLVEKDRFDHGMLMCAETPPRSNLVKPDLHGTTDRTDEVAGLREWAILLSHRCRRLLSDIAAVASSPPFSDGIGRVRMLEPI